MHVASSGQVHVCEAIGLLFAKLAHRLPRRARPVDPAVLHGHGRVGAWEYGTCTSYNGTSRGQQAAPDREGRSACSHATLHQVRGCARARECRCSPRQSRFAALPKCLPACLLACLPACPCLPFDCLCGAFFAREATPASFGPRGSSLWDLEP
jgi:hypothetical protein